MEVWDPSTYSQPPEKLLQSVNLHVTIKQVPSTDFYRRKSGKLQQGQNPSNKTRKKMQSLNRAQLSQFDQF